MLQPVLLPLPWGNCLWYPLNRKLVVGLQNWSDSPAGIRTPDNPAHSFVTVLTRLLPPYKKMQVEKFMSDRQLQVSLFLTSWWHKLKFKKMKLSLCMPWNESGGVASVTLNLATLPTVCGGRSLWDSQHEAGCARCQFWCQLNKHTHLKVMLHYVILLQDILLTCQVQSKGNHGVVKFSYLQLTFHSGWSDRNFAALVFLARSVTLLRWVVPVKQGFWYVFCCGLIAVNFQVRCRWMFLCKLLEPCNLSYSEGS